MTQTAPASGLSLSTSWNGGRHANPTDALREIRELGFDAVELYAHWLPAQLERLEASLDDLGMRVNSLHGPCPVSADPHGGRAPYGDWLAEVDQARRAIAVDAHRRTIDAAARLGGRAVVVHLGNSGARHLQPRIFEAIRTNGQGSPEHERLLAEARAEREKASGNGALEAAIRSAREIGEHALGTGVGLGLECRDGFVEIPSVDEYDQIFEACKGLPVFYWHDVGHGEKLQNAGLVEGEAYLRRHGQRLLGLHLHDTSLDRDHQAPGQGETDFSFLLPYLRADVVRTMELSPRVPAEHIRPGVEHLRRAGIL